MRTKNWSQLWWSSCLLIGITVQPLTVSSTCIHQELSYNRMEFSLSMYHQCNTSMEFEEFDWLFNTWPYSLLHIKAIAHSSSVLGRLTRFCKNSTILMDHWDNETSTVMLPAYYLFMTPSWLMGSQSVCSSSHLRKLNKCTSVLHDALLQELQRLPYCLWWFS